MSQLAWRQIRAACEEQRLPIREWEDDLQGKVLDYILAHGSMETAGRYLTDVNFHDQLNRMIALVCAAILDHDPLTDPSLRKRVEELGDIFRSEAGLE